MLVLRLNLLLIVIISVVRIDSSYSPPKLEIVRLSQTPIISAWANNSEFLYNYNSAYMPMANDTDSATLLVRVQNLKTAPSSIYDIGPSKIAWSQTVDQTYLKYSYITYENIIIDNDRFFQYAGAEDPRIVLSDGVYYLFYTAVGSLSNGGVRAQLALATCDHDCLNKNSWHQHGPVFPDVFWTKSGSLLIHNQTHSYLFFNDSNIAIAQTKDRINYELISKILLSTRSDHFDSALVEAGPEPLKLSDNNYLFLYNSAQSTTVPNPKPGWNLQYNLGWAILSGDDPTNVLARSESPLLSPELDWERCDKSTPLWSSRGLTPLVVFVEGWKKTAENTFLVWYQGCDSTTGLAELRVSFP